ncbi:uncharacterized protein LOC125868617 [Solanum stenotomum]|uniref:uncharacterized protein LOC125868617 n=1 Tax=Solanum stenotomum TaxID=172797 RepID=UPI0020D000FC|nr:uncharacterized protein LOC125868617 [Solanum stenotomum]
MPRYAKLMNDLVTKQRAVSFENDERLQHCSATSTRSLVKKKKDLGAFTIPCTIGLLHFVKALCDLGSSINLMPLSIYKKLGLGDPKPTVRPLLMTDRTVNKPIGVLHDDLVKLETFIFLVSDLKSVLVVNHIMEQGSEVSIEERLGVDPLAAVMMNVDGDDI